MQPDDDEDADSERPTLVPKYDVEAAARAAAIPSSRFPRDDHRPEMPTYTDPVELEAARVASTFTSPPPAIEVAEVEISEFAITNEYESAFGSFARVPYLAVSHAALTSLNLEPRAGFLLALIDGALDIQTILDVSGMPAADTLGILQDLMAKRIVQLR